MAGLGRNNIDCTTGTDLKLTQLSRIQQVGVRTVTQLLFWSHGRASRCSAGGGGAWNDDGRLIN